MSIFKLSLFFIFCVYTTQVCHAFDEACYLHRYPDVVSGWVNNGGKAIDHWKQKGKAEGRNPDCDSSSKNTIAAAQTLDVACYLYRYPDVAAAVVKNETTAIEHWNNFGKKENRIPGCDINSLKNPTPTEFNEACYLERYPDVTSDWVIYGRLAQDHYKRHGIAENRIAGCTAKSSPMSGPIANSMSIRGPGTLPIKISIDNVKFAGAVSSLIWNNKEFINIADHGRQLQSAMQIDGYGECNNPTEAGSAADGKNNSSSSKIMAVYVKSSSEISTRSQMAFWSRTVTGACLQGFDPRVKSTLSNHTLTKNIKIGEFEDPSIIGYTVKFKHGRGTVNQKIVYEFLTGYLTNEFNRFYYVNKADKLIYEYGPQDLKSIAGQGFPEGSFAGNPQKKNTFDPIVMSTADQNYAMGVYVPQKSIERCNSSSFGYMTYKFNLAGVGGPEGQPTNKWSLALIDALNSPCITNNERSFKIYIVVGNVKTVHTKLLNIMKTVD